jgi:hypothetical protein
MKFLQLKNKRKPQLKTIWLNPALFFARSEPRRRSRRRCARQPMKLKAVFVCVAAETFFANSNGDKRASSFSDCKMRAIRDIEGGIPKLPAASGDGRCKRAVKMRFCAWIV